MPLNIGSNQFNGTRQSLVAVNRSHPLLAGVNSFDGLHFRKYWNYFSIEHLKKNITGGATSYRFGVSLNHMQTTATLVANWSDTLPLVAVKRRVVWWGFLFRIFNGWLYWQVFLWFSLNFYPVSTDIDANNGWNSLTDGARLMANALSYKPAFVAPTLSASVSSVMPPRFWMCSVRKFDIYCIDVSFVYSAAVVGTVLSTGGTPITELGVVCSRALNDSTPTIEEVGSNGVFKTLTSATVKSGCIVLSRCWLMLIVTWILCVRQFHDNDQ